jgi:hypothetical protein
VVRTFLGDAVVKQIQRDSRYVIIDNVIPPRFLNELRRHIQNERYTVPLAGGWQKVWRLGDLTPVVSDAIRVDGSVKSDVLCRAGNIFRGIALQYPEIIGNFDSDWHDLVLRIFLYPRGTRLSWHTDAKAYSGAVIYYAHPTWSPSWGGELFIADISGLTKARRISSGMLPYEHINRYLLDKGTGTFVTPKPNRLVLLQGGTYHMLARVDPDAGEHVRSTISGFFVRADR